MFLIHQRADFFMVKLGERNFIGKEVNNKLNLSGMKKALPVIIILVIIVAALVGWKFLGKGKKTTTQGGTQQTQTTPSQTTGESFTGKIKDAFMRGIPLKCTYKKDDQNFSTGYLKNKKYYAEVMAAGKMGYIILVDNCMWAWNKDKADGVKMCFAQQQGEDMWSSFEANQKSADFDYNCSPAIVNDSIFTPPSNVKFANIDELMNQATQSGQ